MEAVPPPPPVPPPGVGESSKVHDVLQFLDIAKILALVIGIVGFLYAAWDALAFWFPGMAYGIIVGIFNLIAYTKMDRFIEMVKYRRYYEAREEIKVWMIMLILFGLVVGVLLLLCYMHLDELASRSPQPPPAYPPPPSPPAPPPSQ